METKDMSEPEPESEEKDEAKMKALSDSLRSKIMSMTRSLRTRTTYNRYGVVLRIKKVYRHWWHFPWSPKYQLVIKFDNIPELNELIAKEPENSGLSYNEGQCFQFDITKRQIKQYKKGYRVIIRFTTLPSAYSYTGNGSIIRILDVVSN